MRHVSLCWEVEAYTRPFPYSTVNMADTLNPEEVGKTQRLVLCLSVRKTDFSFPAPFIIFFQVVARTFLAMKDYTKLLYVREEEGLSLISSFPGK